MLNTAPDTATGCAISPKNAPAGTIFSYQQTNEENALIGTPNTPADITAGGAQAFVFSLTPSQAFAATEIRFSFDCTNSAPAADTPGVNSFRLTSSDGPTPDIVALVATLSGDGIVTIPVGGAEVFAVATVNVGAGGLITAAANTGSVQLPLALTLCQTNPSTGVCINPTTPAAGVTMQINTGETPTLAIFGQASGTVVFDPALHRINVTFATTEGGTVGSTSVAVRTP
jgi:hypothetical protein